MTSTVVIGGYRTLPECLMTITHRANSAKVLRASTPTKLYSYETILERLAQDLEDMAAALGQCIQVAHARCARETSPGLGPWPPPISPASERVW